MWLRSHLKDLPGWHFLAGPTRREWRKFHPQYTKQYPGWGSLIPYESGQPVFWCFKHQGFSWWTKRAPHFFSGTSNWTLPNHLRFNRFNESPPAKWNSLVQNHPAFLGGKSIRCQGRAIELSSCLVVEPSWILPMNHWSSMRFWEPKMRFWEPKMRFWEPKIHQTFLLLLTKPPPPRNLTGPTPSLKPGPRLDVSKMLCPIQDFADFSLAPAIIGFHYPLVHLPMKPVDSQLMKQQKKEGESLNG